MQSIMCWFSFHNGHFVPETSRTKFLDAAGLPGTSAFALGAIAMTAGCTNSSSKWPWPLHKYLLHLADSATSLCYFHLDTLTTWDISLIPYLICSAFVTPCDIIHHSFVVGTRVAVLHSSHITGYIIDRKESHPRPEHHRLTPALSQTV